MLFGEVVAIIRVGTAAHMGHVSTNVNCVVIVAVVGMNPATSVGGAAHVTVVSGCGFKSPGLFGSIVIGALGRDGGGTDSVDVGAPVAEDLGAFPAVNNIGKPVEAFAILSQSLFDVTCLVHRTVIASYTDST